MKLRLALLLSLFPTALTLAADAPKPEKGAKQESATGITHSFIAFGNETYIMDETGKITVIEKPGIGHHPHSLKDPAPIVDFVLKHAPR